MSEPEPNLCIACKKEMPVLKEGLWIFSNGPFSLVLRVITKNEKNQVEAHQICLSCIKSIVANLKEPEQPANVVCLPKP